MGGALAKKTKDQIMRKISQLPRSGIPGTSNILQRIPRNLTDVILNEHAMPGFDGQQAPKLQRIIVLACKMGGKELLHGSRIEQPGLFNLLW